MMVFFFIIAEKNKDRFGNAHKINSKSRFHQIQKIVDSEIQLS